MFLSPRIYLCQVDTSLVRCHRPDVAATPCQYVPVIILAFRNNFILYDRPDALLIVPERDSRSTSS